MRIEDIKGPEDIKSLSYEELDDLSDDIRKFLIDNVSKTGGHLSSNLGVVELSVAMHKVFDSPRDKIIFDVGHQCYIHKILTGRASKFSTLRQYNGLAGFQKRCESEHDSWEAGHSSTSLSAALGFAIARDLNGEDYKILSVIGDGSMGGGISLEALNQIGYENKNMIIIFNDNNMSISANVGALSDTFTNLRSSKSYLSLKADVSDVLNSSKMGSSVYNSMRSVKNSIKKHIVKSSIFGEFNLDYIGPIDGHDIKELVRVLEVAKEHKGPIVVHVLTKKGMGYEYAEDDAEGEWHGVSAFNKETGKSLKQIDQGYMSWSEIISETLVRLAKTDKDIVALSPAMITGSKLKKFFELYPERSFDCGIAEEHATILAASLATLGKKPFLSIYSSFLQRSYDQINHDVARLNVPVVIGIDRAGLVGEDGDTHHGVFDITMMKSIPNLILCQPKDAIEAQNLMFTAFKQSRPIAIRYPRGVVSYKVVKDFELIDIGSWTSKVINERVDIVVISYGEEIVKIVEKAISNNMNMLVVNARFFKPLDEKMLNYIADYKKPIIVYETDMLSGGLSSSILEYYCDNNKVVNMTRIGIKDNFVSHGSTTLLRKKEKIDINYLFSVIEAKLNEN